MVKFLLVLVDNGNPRKLPGFFLKFFEMPTLPQKDEYIEIDGDQIMVSYVSHCLRKGFAEVNCDCCATEIYNVFAEDKGAGWKIEVDNDEEQEEVKKVISAMFSERDENVDKEMEIKFDFVN